MTKLIFDLLDMTRIESEQRKRELTDINLTDIAKKSIETCILVAKERNIAINFDVHKDVAMKGDVFEVETILNNLISNAVKYNKDNGNIDINITADDKWVVIDVADTGIGLKKEELDKLFKDFIRIKNEKTRNILGSGLGLSTVKKLTHLYGGKISVKSEFAKGSTFSVELLKNSQI
jgi:signal transduction histidine kinase